jgi:hypothetical protein
MRLPALACSLAFLCPSVFAQIGGSFVSTGQGCPDASLLYEQFAPGSFDLSGAPSVDWIPNGQLGYVVTRGLGRFLPTAGGTNLGLVDESISAPVALGFSFPYPTGQGSTTQIEVSSNGYVYLEPGTITTPRCCDGAGASFRSFRNATPSFAVLGMDLNPGNGGVVWFNSAPGVAYVTWDQVPEDQTLGINTFQIQFTAGGNVTMVWTNAATLTHTALVGWSGGGGVEDQGPFDFSSATAFNMGPSSGPLTIEAPLTRIPLVGQSFRLDLRNVPPNALAGGLLSGLQQQDIPLDPLGMPDCRLLVSNDFLAFPLTLTPPTGVLTIPIPATPALAGVVLETQATVIAPAINALGVSTSNRGTLTIGNIEPVVVRARGADSQNDDDTQGFFQIANATPFRIVSLRLDFVRSTVPNALYFDTNEIGMADRFDGGNSRTALCRGTYRNASDVTVGLDYASSIASPCGGTSRTGWVGSNFVGTAGSVRTLDFLFTGFDPGEVFEFDADTDGGPGNAGALAGLVATVRLSNGSVRTGQLLRITHELAQVNL